MITWWCSRDALISDTSFERATVLPSPECRSSGHGVQFNGNVRWRISRAGSWGSKPALLRRVLTFPGLVWRGEAEGEGRTTAMFLRRARLRFSAMIVTESDVEQTRLHAFNASL